MKKYLILGLLWCASVFAVRNENIVDEQNIISNAVKALDVDPDGHACAEQTLPLDNQLSNLQDNLTTLLERLCDISCYNLEQIEPLVRIVKRKAIMAMLLFQADPELVYVSRLKPTRKTARLINDMSFNMSRAKNPLSSCHQSEVSLFLVVKDAKRITKKLIVLIDEALMELNKMYEGKEQAKQKILCRINGALQELKTLCDNKDIGF